MSAIVQEDTQFSQRLFDQIKADIEEGRLVLPTLPEVALRVRDEVESDSSTADSVAHIVATDTALSARLIRVANSPMYRGSAQITDIRMAVSRMGMTVVRSLVTGIVMQQIFQATSKVLDNRLRRLWEHSTTVAAIAQMLAKQYTRIKPDEALLAGLIHDIGALPILVKAESMPKLLDSPALLDQVIFELHGRLGEFILHSWEFDPAFVTVVLEHENLQRTHTGAADLTDVVMVANLQAHMGEKHTHDALDWSSISAFERLGLDTTTEEIELGEEIEEIVIALNG